MKILLLAPVHREKEFLKQKKKLPFLLGQGQQSWYEALKELGHEVFVFRYSDSIMIPNTLRIYLKSFFINNFPLLYAKFQRFQDRFYFTSFENIFRNLKIIAQSKKIKPNIVIISGGVSCIYPSTIKKIKNKFNCRVILMSGVNPMAASTVVERKMIKNRIIDLVVENDRGYADLWKKIGAEKTLVLPISSVDPKIHRKVRLSDNEKKEYCSDVCFVGSLTRKRQEMLKQVRNDSYKLRIWGDIPQGLKINDFLKSYYLGKAYGDKMIKIFNASKIVINFQPQDMISGGNMRTYEIAGSGTFQLTDKIDKERFEDGKNLVLFKDVNDLKRKIKYFLKNEGERKKIAEEGQKNVYKYHTYKNHFSYLLKYIGRDFRSG